MFGIAPGPSEMGEFPDDVSGDLAYKAPAEIFGNRQGLGVEFRSRLFGIAEQARPQNIEYARQVLDQLMSIRVLP